MLVPYMSYTRENHYFHSGFPALIPGGKTMEKFIAYKHRIGYGM